MAEALLNVVFENLLSLVQNEFSTVSGIKTKAQKLSSTLELIKAVLEDAEHKQLTNRSIKLWLQQLKDAVYVLDDILDECSIESDRLKGASSFKPKNIMFRREIGIKFKEITNRFDQIAENKNKFLLQVDGSVRERSAEMVEWRQTSSVIAESKVYGRDDDKEKIVQFFLTQARDSHSLSVYPIVGLGGVGKTTLAQLVYNDHRVSINFHIKFWVCVSEVFSLNSILSSIIESISGLRLINSTLDILQRKVQELLQGKRYLLVLDDVWKRNQELEFGLTQDNWNKLKSVLSCGSKGSSVLVSTRDKDVAVIMGTCQPHHLSGLSENECWLLFKEYAFGHEEEEPKLVAIGKEIVKKCGGLPLAAQALGGLMRSRTQEKEWLEVKESEIWTLPDENVILPALRLSYLYLTPTLKQCFAFCAIFPKDTKIMKDDLIHLWMANGFISSRKNMEVEDVGNMVWHELYQKSFFQDIKMDANSEYTSFKMHDLVHDLAQFVTGPECMILENSNTNLSASTHHISFDYPTLLSTVNKGAFKKVESLRTLYRLKFYDGHALNPNLFPKNSSLRVLIIESPMLHSLESFTHLRYLELHGVKAVKPIFDSIHTLRKLEVLKLTSFWKIQWFPEHLSRLQNLRHLVITDCHKSYFIFPNIGKLSCLRTLSIFIVRPKTGHSLAELHNLNLGGKLRVEGLKNVGSLTEARDANLMCKKDLQELCLSWENTSAVYTERPGAEQVIEALQPHSNLKRLEIRLYEGLCLPSWISILSSLVSLKLRDCNNFVQLSPLGHLPSLKIIYLSRMDNVQYMDDNEPRIGVEVGAFPSLEKLILDRLPNIERLLKVERGEMFSHLSDLTIIECPKLVFPPLSSVTYMYVEECNDELLRQISSFNSLTTLHLNRNKDVTSVPEGMMRNLSSLKTLTISGFSKLNELPNESFNLPLEHLCISRCGELESLPELIWEGLQSLRTIDIVDCEGLRSLPEGFQHLTSLEVLTIQGCPILKKRCEREIGEDWDKIAYIPKLLIW